MKPADEPSEMLDLLIEQLQHDTPDSASPPDLDPEIARMVQQLHLLASATPVPADLVAKLQRRLAVHLESLVMAQRDQPASPLAGRRSQGAASDWGDAAIAEPGPYHAANAPASSLGAAAQAAGTAPPRPPAMGTASDVRRTRPTILVVDDDRELIELLAFALRRAGMEAVPAYDAPTALRILHEPQPDQVVLDVNLGCSNGLDVLKALRRRSSRIPVIMLTALNGEINKLQGLELGANDYLSKPFSHRELIARIRAQLRRNPEMWSPMARETRRQVGSLVLDVSEHSVTRAGQRVSLTVTEFRLLEYLMLNAARVVPTGELLKQVWGHDDAGGSDVVRVTIHRLRRKLEADPSRPTLLHTIPGVGALLRPDAEQLSPPPQGTQVGDNTARRGLWSDQAWMDGAVDSSGQLHDYYAVLQVQPGADPAVIEAAYRRLMKEHHPDRAGDDPRDC